MEEKYCRNCGAEMRKGGRFCPNCGYEKKIKAPKDKPCFSVTRKRLLIFMGVLFVGAAGIFFAVNTLSSPKKTTEAPKAQTTAEASIPTVRPTVQPTPSPSVKTTPAAEGLGNYSIQLGAFTESENVDKCLEKAENSGFSNTRVKMVTDSGKRLYRVSIYGFQSMEEANEKLKVIQANGFDDAFVTKN